MSLKNTETALAGVAQWIGHQLQTEKLLVWFLVGTQAWAAGWVPVGGVQEATD